MVMYFMAWVSVINESTDELSNIIEYCHKAEHIFYLLNNGENNTEEVDE